MKKNKVLIEKYKGFEIYYDKDKERFVANKPKFDINFEARTLWEIKGYIKESRIKKVNKFGYIKSGYLGKAIARIHILSINKDTETIRYEILDDTEKNFSIHLITEDNINLCKIYKLNQYNTKIFNEVRELQKEIEKLENKQKALVKRLK